MKKRILELNKITNSLLNFEKDGFLIVSSSNIDFRYEYHRYNDEKIDVLDYGFYIDKYKDYSYLSAISFKIIFPIINKILLIINSESPNNKDLFLNDTTIFATPQIGLDTYINFHYMQQKLSFIKDKIFYKAIFEEALLVFQEQYNTSVLPFFDQIKTLQQVNNEIIEKYKWEKWNNFISGNTYFKAIIIMKLCNNKKYEEFSQFYSDRIAKGIKDGHVEFKDFYNSLNELLLFLNSGAYRDLLNDIR